MPSEVRANRLPFIDNSLPDYINVVLFEIIIYQIVFYKGFRIKRQANHKKTNNRPIIYTVEHFSRVRRPFSFLPVRKRISFEPLFKLYNISLRPNILRHEIYYILFRNIRKIGRVIRIEAISSDTAVLTKQINNRGSECSFFLIKA